MMDAIETRFSPESGLRWVRRHWVVSVYASGLYLVAVFVGRWYMQDKPAFNLRRALVFWNTCLAILSGIGLYTFVPPLAKLLSTGGLGLSVCYSRLYTEPTLSLWLFLFTVLKMVELGDTAFIVLRKTPISVLHWYHHVTVLMYCWSFYPVEPALTNWFSTMNYGAHAVMYSYYALKGSGYRLPVWVSQCVTVLQMAQFLVCMGCNFYAYYLKSNGFPECALGTDTLFYISLAMYGSYTLLFVNFFYQRYVNSKRKSA